MNKRSPAGWLLGGLLLLTGLGLAGSLVPARTCVTCGGLAIRMLGLTTPSLVDDASLNCPDCGDWGKVSLFKPWMRHRVSEPVAQVLRGLPDLGAGRGWLNLNKLLQSDGKDPQVFFKDVVSVGPRITNARFFKVGGKDYLILLLNTSSGTIPGTSAAAVVLATPEGRVLDFVQMSCDSRAILFTPIFPISTFSDEGLAAVQALLGSDSPSLDFETVYQLTQWRGAAREGKIGIHGRVAWTVSGDKLEVLK